MPNLFGGETLLKTHLSHSLDLLLFCGFPCSRKYKTLPFTIKIFGLPDIPFDDDFPYVHEVALY